MEQTDEVLMIAVRDGDVAKLEVLFDRHHRRLFEFFSRLTGNRTAAEDLVQDVFFRILKYRATYNQGSRFTTWMFQISRNARIDYFNKRRMDGLIAEEPLDVPSPAAIPSREFEHKQEAALLKRALMELPDDRRELLVLARYEEMKYGDIAAVLQVEVGAVKARVHRAMKELRDIFFRISCEKTPCNVKNSETTLPTM